MLHCSKARLRQEIEGNGQATIRPTFYGSAVLRNIAAKVMRTARMYETMHEVSHPNMTVTVTQSHQQQARTQGRTKGRVRMSLSLSLKRVCLLALILMPCLVNAGDARPVADGVRLFEEKIAPILNDQCLKCHGADDKVKGGLLLTSYANLIAGGDNGPAIDLDNPGNSLLLKMISYSDDDHQMPPKEKLAQEQLDLLGKWVRSGAVWGRKDLGPVTAAGKSVAVKPVVKNKGGGAWSYRKPTRPTTPAVKNNAWVRNPIDAFILSGLDAKGLKPAAEADRRVLMRRATYDLLGLPPSPQEVEAFVLDTDPLAYEKLIERLLINPHYGEKWGRHWLDVVGFAQTNGFERDGDKPNAWRYRDYVIRALNEDKPYDLFLAEQLAGDQFEKPTADSVIASGFCRLGQWDDEPADREQAHYDHIDGIVSTTTQAMLGISLGCARCHNHKKDPLTQEDYYRMVAFFQGLQPMAVSGENIEVTIPSDAATKQAYAARITKLQEQITRAETDFSKRASKGDKTNASAVLAEQIAARGAEIMGKDAFARYGDQLMELSGLKALNDHPDIKKDVPREGKALAAVEGTLRPTNVLKRGNPHTPGKKVTPGFPQVLGAKELPANVPRPRLQLANWIGSPENPLTARVMANRLWQHHFGKGIVVTSNDFGGFGEQPTNQRLLDWLACEFMARGWKLKSMHRLIMTSNTYRQSSVVEVNNLAKDPINALQWRFSMRRLGAEEIRDSVLAVSGELNLAMGGPDIFPPLPHEVLSTQSMPGSGWGQSSATEAARRSIYIKVKRSLPYPLLTVHDSADTEASCPVRFSSTVPTQALTMMNSEFMNQQAARLAQRIQRDAGADQAKQIRVAVELVTQRPATDDDVKRGQAFLQKYGGNGLTSFSLLLLNLNEFVYLD